MIKAKLTNKLNGRNYFILGITDIEIANLKDGDPHGLIMSAFGYDVEPCADVIVLVYAPTYKEVHDRINNVTASPHGLSFPGPKGPKKLDN